MNFLSTDPKIKIIQRFNVDMVAPGATAQFYFHITDNGLGLPIYMPIMVARGSKPGPTLGFTAAVHGNELNGIKVIHKLMKEIEADIQNLSGAVVAVPVVNTVGALNTERVFDTGEDLNRIMPGKNKGNSSSQFAYRFVRTIVKPLDYLVDLHLSLIHI